MKLTNIHTTLLQIHTKQKMNDMVDWVGISQKRFDILFNLFIGNDKLLVQKSGWPLSYCVQKKPQFIQQHLPLLINKLATDTTTHTFKRDTLRLLQFVIMPINLDGILMHQCFNIIQSYTEKPATKAFALHNLIHLQKKYPGIEAELVLIIQNRWSSESPAFKSVAKKILAKYAHKMYQ